MLKPKLVIFDLDGTLVEFPKNYLFSELERILTLIEHPLPEKLMVEHSFSSFDFFGFAASEIQEQIQTTYWEHFNWLEFPNSKIFSFTNSILQQLSEMEIHSAIATARHCEHHELLNDIHPTGILDFFKHIEVRQCKLQDWKDKTPQIKKILDVTGYDAKDAILIGDIPADIESAKLAGLGAVVAVLSGGIREDILKSYKPDVIIPDISHLPNLFKK